MRVLVVEDDRPVANFIRQGLEAEHYAVDVAANGEDAQFMAQEYDYDLMLLDLKLPDLDGLRVLKKVRAKKADLCVLILSARTEVQTRVQALDLGADDYLCKPFSFAELSARVRALLRRRGRAAESVLRCGDLELKRVQRTVKRGGKRIEMTAKEFALLEYLMLHAGHPVTRAMLIEHVWNLSFDTMTNVVDVYINYLRKKLGDEKLHTLIRTKRGVGYQLGDGNDEEERPYTHLKSA